MCGTDYNEMSLPLPRDLHNAILAESRTMGMPASRLVTQVMEKWLKERRRIRRREEIRQFALATAGTSLDLDPDLEAAAVEDLQRLA